MTSSYHRKALNNPHVNIRVTYMVSRHDTEDGGGQGVVAGDGQEVPGVASHRGPAGGHEPHQPPELHRHGSQAPRR